MSVEELDSIGKTVALTVQNRLHFQAISFYVFEREDGYGHFAGGMMTREGDDEKEYIIGSTRIPVFLTLTTVMVQVLLEDLISGKARLLYGLA